MASLKKFYILHYSNYNFLLELRDKTQREFDATSVVVVTTNMDYYILMENILNKKKRAIARIDSSEEGRAFLTLLIRDGEEHELDTLLKRLRVGSRIYKRRLIVNKDLINFQTQIQELAENNKDFRILVARFISNKIQFFKELQNNVDETVDDIFVYSVIIEELEWLFKKVTK